MKSQALLLRAILLLAIVACGQVQGKAHKEECAPEPSDVKVEVLGCQERTVRLNTCVGLCLSEESILGKACWCCKPVKKEPVEVEIVCTSGNSAYIGTKIVYKHDQCACSRCFENWILMLSVIHYSCLWRLRLLCCKWNKLTGHSALYLPKCLPSQLII